MKVSIQNIQERGYWTCLNHQMYETSRFNNIFHRASRPCRAARFVFEQNDRVFFFMRPTLHMEDKRYKGKNY